MVVVRPQNEEGVPANEWRATLCTVRLTKHARKKLLTRFQLASDDDALAFVLQVMFAADDIYARKDGATAWRYEDVVVVTRPLDETTHLVLTCFSRGEMGRLKARRRALYKRLRREQQEMDDDDEE